MSVETGPQQFLDEAMKRIPPVLLIGLLSSLFLCGIIFGASIEKRADNVLIEKNARKLTLLQGTAVIQTYRIALGAQPIGPKQCQGDHRTPEGRYIIDGRNKNSHFHWSLHVSYPNAADRAVARKRGCNPGGDIFIHGLPNGYGWMGKAHTAHDWTLGCIAVTDQEIEEIWRLVPNGTPVEIRP